MYTENSKDETIQDYTAGDSGSASAKDQNILKQGADAYVHAEQAVSEAYDKTSQKVSETYAQVKNYSHENPGKTILIALGVGVGVGLLLSANTRRSRTSRIAQPVVNALSDIAAELFR